MPNAPVIPCTEAAPTGSSILNTFSIKRSENTNNIPANNPIATAPHPLTTSQPAVTATNPASVPLSVILNDGFPYFIQDNANADTVPAAAAKFVVKNICEIATALAVPLAAN